MIFSRFIKKKWQHKDSNVRVEAINSALSTADTEQRAIISQLALHDDSENVRRAALIKLADYSVWITHSQLNSMAKIKRYAQTQVESMLVKQNNVTISEQQKLDYINEHSHYSFYETWLKSTDNTAIIIALFEKIASKHTVSGSTPFKPQLLISLFIQKTGVDVQRYIVDKVSDLDTLEKLQKKSTNVAVTEIIDHKINELRAAIEQPIKLRKKISLNLAKFQALKEQGDYLQYLDRRALLEAEWREIEAQLSCLSVEEQTTYIEKRQNIGKQLDSLFVVKAEQFEQDKIAQQLIIDKENAREHLDKTFDIISQTLATSIFENEDIDERQYHTLFDKLAIDIETSLLNTKEKSQYLEKIAQQKRKLEQLPIIAASVAEATQLVLRISQLAVPTNNKELNERLDIFVQWQTNWRDIEKKSAGSLPDSIKDAALLIQKEWNTAIKPLQQAQKKEFMHTQKKIQDVKRLVNTGKYNAAFGVYKKSKALFSKLSLTQQQRLQREFDSVSAQIDDLTDWEHYIATPRKQQLLLDIKKIVEMPLDNPNEQAEKVKGYRKVWNSLGHADDENEKTLNNEFNDLCEKAFTPCRLFFAEQEKLRDQHLVARKSLLDEAQSLAEEINRSGDDIDFKTLDTRVNKLQQLWQNSGQVDRALYKDLSEQFSAAMQPVKLAIKAFHKENIAAKESLINTAHSLLAMEDITSAISEVKALQKKWRNIGYAGPRSENKLWQTFRQVNDNIFSKRDEQSSNETAQLLVEKEKLNAEIENVESIFSQDASIGVCTKILEETASLKQRINSTRSFGEFESKLTKLEKRVNNQLMSLKKEKEKQQWVTLFEVIETATVSNTCATDVNGFDSLSSYWQKKLKELNSKDGHFDRNRATLELEILAGVASPEELQQQRMEVQVGLIQDQMSTGGAIDLPARFAQWLTLGKVTNDDINMLNRLKPIFI